MFPTGNSSDKVTENYPKNIFNIENYKNTIENKNAKNPLKSFNNPFKRAI